MRIDDNGNLNDARMEDLLILLVEGVLDQEGIGRIERWLSSGPEAKARYLTFMNDYAAMKAQARSAIDMDEGDFAINDEFDAELWSALAEVERAAESVPMEEAEAERQVIRKVERPRSVHSVSKLSVVTFILSAAALLFFVVLLNLSPNANMEVATLTDSLNAVFAGSGEIPNGSRLLDHGDSLWLQKGIVKIEFDYGAQVVIEAPAEFQLNSADIITLRSGRIHAYVPGRSKGFTVTTPNASIIDLGTEFAVKVDFDGASEVHMFKGKASLIPGAKGEVSGSSQILTENQARRVEAAGTVREIQARPTDFVRDVDSENGFTWRGHTTVNLADIVGGGNGFGTGRLEVGINPETGVSAYRDRERGKASSYQGFQSVDDNPYVDGVFCPEQGSASVQVSTAGDVFEDCPLTTKTYWGFVMNSGWFGQSEGKFDGNLALEGTVYGSTEFPAIAMHPNLGVTFDLDAIRQSVGHFGIDRFTAMCGISETVLENRTLKTVPKASFYVLLDGAKVFERTDATPTDEAADIDVAVPATARFLTLMVTEGSDGTYEGDWTLFTEPLLHLVAPEL